MFFEKNILDSAGFIATFCDRYPRCSADANRGQLSTHFRRAANFVRDYEAAAGSWLVG